MDWEIIKFIPVWRNWQTNMKQQIIDEFQALKNNHPYYNGATWKIYGPYQSKKDLRIRIMVYDGIHKITISYPKFIMECKLQRLLENNEEVHHKDNLEFNDIIENFEIKTNKEHKKEHMIAAEYFICPICKTGFKLEGIKLSRYKTERKRFSNMAGPFCSKSCAGTYRPINFQKIVGEKK